MSSALFEPIRLGGLDIPNRIVISPMCQYSAEEGRPTTWHLIHLGHLALSGAGLMILEATAVTPEGRITAGDLGLWSDQTEAALTRLLADIRRESAIPIGIQLAHAGRKASVHVPWESGAQVPLDEGGWVCVAPSPLPQAPADRLPVPLDLPGLARIREAFGAAAKRAVRAGFELIELHFAHGYLLHQFLSPLSNQRQDQYGGSAENRTRFPLEVYDAVRAAVPPQLPVGVRVSATDWAPAGLDLDTTIAFARALDKRGCAFMDVSSGGLTPVQQIPVGPGYQVEFAAAVKRATGMPTIAVGLITEARQAEEILVSGQADMIALARGILYDPRWPWHAAAELGAEVRAPKQYWRSQPREYKRLFGTTSIEQR
ncbi:MAG: NADH:flavin oxidoreductase/NADH oxidase [Acetobacteraceae bacterium]|nr:NADH:flavin oxidoreductase/NADH oxidase [Acetobacteraceae bacterium]